MEIRFKDVSVSKDDNQLKIEKVSFHIQGSGIYTFIGDSKSGKDIIGDLIAFLYKPSTGIVTIDDYNTTQLLINKKKLRSKIGYMFENVYDNFLYDDVKSELLYSLKVFNKYKTTRNKRIEDSLKLVGLDKSYINKKISGLCINEVKKIALASILIYNPKIIILNEPTLGLSSKEKKDLKKLLLLLKEKYNKIIIVLSKDTSFIYSIATKIYLMYDGQIVIVGDKEILNDYEMLREYNLDIPKAILFVSNCIDENINLSYSDDLKSIAKEVVNYEK